MGGNGFFEMGGKTLALSLVDPSSFTDYAQDDALIAQQLRAAGIDATFSRRGGEQVERGRRRRQLPADPALGQRRRDAVNIYDNWLDDSLVSSTGATGDFERL